MSLINGLMPGVTKFFKGRISKKAGRYRDQSENNEKGRGSSPEGL